MKQKISVIVPTYNASRYVNDMIYSLERQSYSDFETIVVDGLSKDDTVNQLRQSNIPNLVISSEADNGVPQALNRGFGMATGEILLWLNADDFLVSKYSLEKIALAMGESNAKFGYGHTVCVDHKGEIQRTLFAHVPRRGYEDRGNNLITGSLFFSSSCWSKFGGFSEKIKYAFEYEIKKFLSETGGSPVLLRDPISSLRIHQDTITSRMSQEISREVEQIFYDRPRKSRLMVKFERKSSQYKQGTLKADTLERLYNPKKGSNWREHFVDAKCANHNRLWWRSQ